MEHHSTFIQELERVRHLSQLLQRGGAVTAPVTAVTERRAPVAPTTVVDQEQVLQHLSVAFEDIPADTHALVRMVLMKPTEDGSLRSSVLDVLKNVGGDILGQLERVTEQVSHLHILTGLVHHPPYTYAVDGKVIRGARPTVEKVRRLHAGGVTTLINLCEEMVTGDADLTKDALLADELRLVHVKIVDNTIPSDDEVQMVLAAIRESPGPAYIHCEAGVGRTGTMVACYRMHCGWRMQDAFQEARNFGCQMPDQLRFIQDYRPDGQGETSPAAVEATSARLRETAVLNVDAAGLDRALAAVQGGLQ